MKVFKFLAAVLVASAFSLSVSAQETTAENRDSLPREIGRMVHEIPAEIDRAVALRKLESWGYCIDELSEEQRLYLYGNDCQ